MKNDLPCDIVKDLLPGYIEGLSSKVTNIAVEEHLSECTECKGIANNMMSEGVKPMDELYENKDKQLLKKIKNKLNRRTKVIIAVSVAAVVTVTASVYALFTAPIKNVDLSAVKVSAKVYPVSSLEKIEAKSDEKRIVIGKGDNEVKISGGESDNSEEFEITIPDIENDGITVTGSVLDKTEYITTVSWSSPYFLREIRYDAERNEKSDDVLYISAFKTTVLDNKAQDYQSKMTNMEFKQINKIVFVDGGQKTVLWENSK